MHTILSRIRHLLASEEGPTAVEYAVMLALILLAGFVAYTSFGATVSATFSTIQTSVSSGS